MRDFCTRSHVSTLVACLRRACRNLRERAWRVSRLQPFSRAFELPSTKFVLPHHGKRRPSHRGTCSRRVTRLLPYPLPSSEAPLPQAHRRALCGASLAGYYRSSRYVGHFFSHGQRLPRCRTTSPRSSARSSLCPASPHSMASVGNPPATSSTSALRTACSTAPARSTAGGDEQQSFGAPSLSAPTHALDPPAMYIHVRGRKVILLDCKSTIQVLRW